MEGKPLPNVTWENKRQALLNDSRVHISHSTVVGRANSTLTITNLTRSYEGWYNCTASNVVGAAKSLPSSGYLTVNCKYFTPRCPPERKSLAK